MSVKRVNRSIPLLPHEWRDAQRLARQLTRERRELVTPTELIRDLGVMGIRAKLADLDAAKLAAA